MSISSSKVQYITTAKNAALPLPHYEMQEICSQANVSENKQAQGYLETPISFL